MPPLASKVYQTFIVAVVKVARSSGGRGSGDGGVKGVGNLWHILSIKEYFLTWIIPYFHQGLRYSRGLKSEQGADPPWPVTLTTALNFNSLDFRPF